MVALATFCLSGRSKIGRWSPGRCNNGLPACLFHGQQSCSSCATRVASRASAGADVQCPIEVSTDPGHLLKPGFVVLTGRCRTCRLYGQVDSATPRSCGFRGSIRPPCSQFRVCATGKRDARASPFLRRETIELCGRWRTATPRGYMATTSVYRLKEDAKAPCLTSITERLRYPSLA